MKLIEVRNCEECPYKVIQYIHGIPRAMCSNQAYGYKEIWRLDKVEDWCPIGTANEARRIIERRIRPG